MFCQHDLKPVTLASFPAPIPDHLQYANIEDWEILSRAIASGRQNVDTQLDIDDKSARCLSSKFSYSKVGGEKARE